MIFPPWPWPLPWPPFPDDLPFASAPLAAAEELATRVREVRGTELAQIVEMSDDAERLIRTHALVSSEVAIAIRTNDDGGSGEPIPMIDPFTALLIGIIIGLLLE